MKKKPMIKLRANIRPAAEAAPLKKQDNTSPMNFAKELAEAEKKKAATSSINQFTDLGNSEYYRPKKKQISIRLDADLLAWFQKNYPKYQSAINKACRAYMNAERN